MAGKKLNHSAATAIASSSSAEDAAEQRRLKELHRRLVAQNAALRKHIELSTANHVFMDSGVNGDGIELFSCRLKRPVAAAAISSDAHPQIAEKPPLLPEVDCFYSIDHEIAERKKAFVNAVAPPLPDEDDCIFSMEDVVAEKDSAAGIARVVLDDAVERKLKESAAFLEEKFMLPMKDRLDGLEEEGERRDRWFMKFKEESDMREIMMHSAIKKEFRKLEEEGERSEAMIRKLEEQGERRKTLLSSTMEEVVSLKRRLGQEENNTPIAADLSKTTPMVADLAKSSNMVADLAAGIKKRGWIKWIPAAIFVTLGVAVVAKSSK